MQSPPLHMPEAYRAIERLTLRAGILGFMLITLAAGIALPFIMGTSHVRDPAFWSAMVAAPVLLGILWASFRWQDIRVAKVFVAVAFADAWLFTILIQGSGYLVGNYAYLTTIVLLAAFFLSARTTALYAAANLAGVIVIHTVWGLAPTDLALSVAYLVLFSTLLVLLAGLLRRDRRMLKRSNAALIDQVDLHEMVQEATQDVVIALDPTMHIRSMNERARIMAPQLLGRDVNVGDRIDVHLSPEMRRAFVHLKQGMDAHGTGEIEQTFETPIGNRSFHARLMRTNDGGAIMVSSDITAQQVRWEHARQEEEHEREMAQLEKLQQMQKDFINMASHELQTPLTPLRLQARMLHARAATYMTAKDLRAVEVIERNTERLARQVEDILEVVRIGNGRLPIEMLKTDLAKGCARAIADHLPAAIEGGLDLSYHGPDHLAAIADPVRVEQVLGNLLSNAIKFSKAGQDIDVVLEEQDGEAIIHVVDHGAGLDPEEIEGLFQPFTQFHRDVAPRTGTGLGLTICKGIMEAQGGHVFVQSEGRGHGSTFTITLPLEPGNPSKWRPTVRSVPRINAH